MKAVSIAGLKIPVPADLLSPMRISRTQSNNN